ASTCRLARRGRRRNFRAIVRQRRASPGGARSACRSTPRTCSCGSRRSSARRGAGRRRWKGARGRGPRGCPSRTRGSTNSRATVTLLRRAGEIESAKGIAEARAADDATWAIEAAELARLSRDVAAAERWLERCDASDVRAIALRARIALDAGDLARAEQLVE